MNAKADSGARTMTTVLTSGRSQLVSGSAPGDVVQQVLQTLQTSFQARTRVSGFPAGMLKRNAAEITTLQL